MYDQRTQDRFLEAELVRVVRIFVHPTFLSSWPSNITYIPLKLEAFRHKCTDGAHGAYPARVGELLWMTSGLAVRVRLSRTTRRCMEVCEAYRSLLWRMSEPARAHL